MPHRPTSLSANHHQQSNSISVMQMFMYDWLNLNMYIYSDRLFCLFACAPLSVVDILCMELQSPLLSFYTIVSTHTIIYSNFAIHCIFVIDVYMNIFTCLLGYMGIMCVLNNCDAVIYFLCCVSQKIDAHTLAIRIQYGTPNEDVTEYNIMFANFLFALVRIAFAFPEWPLSVHSTFSSLKRRNVCI